AAGPAGGPAGGHGGCGGSDGHAGGGLAGEVPDAGRDLLGGDFGRGLGQRRSADRVGRGEIADIGATGDAVDAHVVNRAAVEPGHDAAGELDAVHVAVVLEPGFDRHVAE